MTRLVALCVACLCVARIAADDAAGNVPAPMAILELASLPDAQLEPGAWSAAILENEHGFRLALAGKTARVLVPAWWDDGALRPREGERYSVRIAYRDDLTKPATVSAHAGIGHGFGDAVLHRFGGEHDGRWKTVEVPLPWDMVARLVDALDPARDRHLFTAITVATDADVPIASLAIRPAIAEDEERFYRETRALLARDQAEARVKTPMPGAKAAPVASARLVAFAWDPGCRLFPYAPVPADAGAPVKVRMCIGQSEPGSFGVYANLLDAAQVDYEISLLTDGTGATLVASVERRTAEYDIVDGAWFPTRLWPAYPADIAAGHSQWFVFDLATRRGESKPGTYSGRIRIHARDGAAVELPLEVDVLPIELPTMEQAGVTMFGCYGNLPPLHDLEFERRWGYGGALLWYSCFAPAIAIRDGRVVVDFTYADDWMRGARKRGFSGAIWYLGGDPFRMPNALHALRHLATVDGAMTREEFCKQQDGLDHWLPEPRRRFVDWMGQIERHAIEHGWPELFPTPHDEPQKWVTRGEWIKGEFKDGCAAIHEADPRIRVYGCIHHVNGWHGVPELWRVFLDDLDVYNTNAVHEDHGIGDKIRAADAASRATGGPGKRFWQYTSIGPGVPDMQRFSFGFWFAAFASTGCTAWGYNSNDGWDLSGRGGDLALTAWPTPYQTIPTPWMLAQRMGLDDRRVVAAYRERFATDAEAMAVLARVLHEAESSRSKHVGDNTELGFFDSLDDAAKPTRWRNELLDRLAAAASTTTR